jgi:hypothetical protein
MPGNVEFDTSLVNAFYITKQKANHHYNTVFKQKNINILADLRILAREVHEYRRESHAIELEWYGMLHNVTLISNL